MSTFLTTEQETLAEQRAEVIREFIARQPGVTV